MIPTLQLKLIAFFTVVFTPVAAFAAPSASFDANQSLLWMYAASFGVGFLTSLTPCVYPMIPIVVGVFGAREEKVSRRKAFALATAYVFGMGAMYSFLGVVFALAGKQFGATLANPWFVLPIVAFYLVLAISMFGAFEIALPASLQSRLSRVGGQGYAGAFGMGLVGGLTAAPCTGPFLAGILGFVATGTSNVATGASLLFVYALGMGVLFWAIAAFAVSLPKSGRWMEWVKSIGAVALLGAGIYFLRPILPSLRALTSPALWFLGVSLGISVLGIAAGAIHLSFHDRPAIKVRKGIAVCLTVVGIAGVINWSLTPPSKLPWLGDEQLAFATAQRERKGVMIDFAAEWCLPCKELETNTFSALSVREAVLDSFIPLKIDVTKETEADEAIKAKYGASNLPAVIFVGPNGRELGRVDEFLPPAEFLANIPALSGTATIGQ